MGDEDQQVVSMITQLFFSSLTDRLEAEYLAALVAHCYVIVSLINVGVKGQHSSFLQHSNYLS